jgi:predicted metallo-beta-lactamase superfamily hydrolase
MFEAAKSAKHLTVCGWYLAVTNRLAIRFYLSRRLSGCWQPMFKLNKIKVTPLAAESFGVRSMCTLVETPDVILLLDAGISLCPYRFSLPPHPIEFKTIASLRKRIAEAADKAEVVTISHYHFDHHTPSYEDWMVNWTEAGETARQIYQDKTVLMKNPRENINPSQRHRAWMFQKTGGKYAKALELADGKTFTFGTTALRFSEAVPHGPDNSMLGWVVMATVEYEGEQFLFAPDVQGPMSTHTADLITAAKPQVIMVGGPPFYLGGFKISEAQLKFGLENLTRVVEAAPLTILEHHALRDEAWRERTEQVHAAALKAEHDLVTAAEFVGEENVFLESRRRQLYRENPPSKEFEKWMRESAKSKNVGKPPLD